MAAAHVQSKISDGGTPAAGGTLAFASNVTSGNTIIAYVLWNYAGCPPSLSDGLGNTYTSVGPNTRFEAGAPYFYLFTAPVTTGGACTITVAAGCSNAYQMVITEVSGLQAGPFDQTGALSKDATTSLTAGSLTPSANGSFIQAAFFRFGGQDMGTFTAGGSFTVGATDTTGSNSCSSEYYVQPTAGAIAAAATVGSNSSSYPIYGFVANFKATAATFVPYPRPRGLVGGHLNMTGGMQQ